MTEIRVTTWMELNEQLYESSCREPLGRFRSSFAFRGMFDAAAPLTTSLRRLGGPYAQSETHLLRAFRKYARRDPLSVPNDSVWNWLALAQHHGLPTRMLDWTYSPHVAMHFATEFIETFDRDGVIWCVDYVKAHARLPQVLRDALRQECADVFTAEMLDKVADTIPKLDELGENDPFALFLEPP